MTLNRRTATFLLLLVTMLWGFAFLAQKNAMEFMGPLSFIGARYLLGGLLILPLAIREFRKKGGQLSKQAKWGIALLSCNFLIGSYLQQYGLIHTTVTNGGFLTGLYVFCVPIILLLVWRTPPHPIVWICAPFALIGLFYLNGGQLDALNQGDTFIIVSAIFWGLHVIMLGHYSRATQMPIFISCCSFLFAGAMASIGAFSLETPSFEVIASGWIEIAYAGIFSTAIAFTLQAICQIHVPPANAAIIMSGESLFAALGAAVIFGERLMLGGYFGAALIFISILLVEAVPALKSRNADKSASKTS